MYDLAKKKLGDCILVSVNIELNLPVSFGVCFVLFIFLIILQTQGRKNSKIVLESLQQHSRQRKDR